MATVSRPSSTPIRTAGTPHHLTGRRLVERIIIYTVMVLIALIFLLPILWMFSTSLKPKSQLFEPVIHWIPTTISLENYQMLLANPSLPIVRWFLNSVLVASAVTLLVVIIDSLAAYAYARMQFVGRRFLFALLLATLFLPGMMFLVPNFLTIAHVGLLNNYLGVIIPGLAGVFGVFFMNQFLQTIPIELEEAAMIDGASPWRTFFSVVLPLARPALATLAVITFLAAWNDFLWPLLILTSADMLTLPPGLATLQGAYTSEYGQMMAGAVIAAVPVLILYIFLQRFIVASVATTGLKG
jgi:multiple sugar transport system permease protein